VNKSKDNEIQSSLRRPTLERRIQDIEGTQFCVLLLENSWRISYSLWTYEIFESAATL